MNHSHIHFSWKEKEVQHHFRTGVSLHSHTLHSRESFEFIGNATAKTPWLSGGIRKQMSKYRARTGRDVDLSHAWWTPPLSALQAWKLEQSQIESLGLNGHVSLSDHDNIDAGLHLSLLEETRCSPISVEWTVPWRRTFFHIGLHNLPAAEATAIMRDLANITSNPDEHRVVEMLAALHAFSSTLIVWNHPLWDEAGIGAAAHREIAASFLTQTHEFLHAFELNGLRPWSENQAVIDFAAAESFPVVSGGDRHGREPNACINLTNAASFPEFVSEVRDDLWSNVLLLPQYRESLRLRIVQNLFDILEDDPDHSLGWTRWSDRCFYRNDQGVEKSLRELWGQRTPAIVNQFVTLMSLMRHSNIRRLLRFALAQAQQSSGE